MDVAKPDVGEVGIHLRSRIEHEGEQSAFAHTLVPQRLCQRRHVVSMLVAQFVGIFLQTRQFDAEVDAVVGVHAGIAGALHAI